MPPRFLFDLTGIDLDRIGSYGVDLVALAEAVRRDVLAEVQRLIGPDPAFGSAGITIDITDVVQGDPNIV